jgi:flagellar protein FliJ
MFRFRLQPVLDTRIAFEEKLLREFSERKRELEKGISILDALHEERHSWIRDMQEMMKREVTAYDIGMHSAYINYLKGRIEYQQMAVKGLAEKVEEKREELLEAVKKRKIMENLKERQFIEYKENAEMMERKALEEISIQAYARRQE